MWQTWVSNNYAQIESVAKIYGPKWPDLVTHFCFYLEKNWLKFDKMPQPDKIRYMSAWFKKQLNWSNSAVSRDNKTNNFSEEDLETHKTFEEPDDQTIDITVLSEEGPEDAKQYIIDIEKTWGSEKADKILKVRFHYLKSLTLTDKILYDLYFTQSLTHRGIAAKLNIPLTSSFLMVKELENKLKDLCLGTQSS